MQSDLIFSTEVERLTRLSPTTIWRLERRDLFPRRIKLGLKRVAWSEREVRDWIVGRMQARQHDVQTAAE